ncbi:MAG: hypothetical protein HWQ38_13790 [Nostoc sp. NMS7]|nr:hypothetical protein [Nostoc sp. NMS7]MBN3947474.1 hypothetical protein [Nostoc sp. NMS7]
MHQQIISIKKIGLTVPESLPAACLQCITIKLRFKSENLSGLHGAIAKE